MTSSECSTFIKKRAGELGFDSCGISKAEKLDEEAYRLESWLNQGMHGEMAYMENHFDKRLDPTKLVSNARSVVSFTYNYFPKKDLGSQGDDYKLSKYAYGKDYHFVIKKKLKLLLADIQETYGNFNGRAFVDSGPVLERVWAKKSGLGWIGKNTLLLNRNMGSFFFLAELILDIDLDYDAPIKDYCGTCTRCMDACPTDAFPAPYILDATKCISYLTIELRDKIPQEFSGSMEGWIFGCDICQDVCPWNKFSKPTTEAEFTPSQELMNMKSWDWEEITEDVFKEIFRKSAVKRTKFKGLKRNIEFEKG